MKLLLAIAILGTSSLKTFSQNLQVKEIASQTDSQKYTYAYISIEGKLFSKKLKVKVDLGDMSEQMSAGREYSELLTDKKSYAAILNHMVENHFELVETPDFTATYSGTGGTSGIVFIMRKKVTD